MPFQITKSASLPASSDPTRESIAIAEANDVDHAYASAWLKCHRAAEFAAALAPAVAAGARLVCIDPRRTETADKCHEHIAIRPGTDAALALGAVTGEQFDTWVDPGQMLGPLDGATSPS